MYLTQKVLGTGTAGLIWEPLKTPFANKCWIRECGPGTDVYFLPGELPFSQ